MTYDPNKNRQDSNQQKSDYKKPGQPGQPGKDRLDQKTPGRDMQKDKFKDKSKDK